MENKQVETILKNIFKDDSFTYEQNNGGMMNLYFLVNGHSSKYVLYIPVEGSNELVDRQIESEATNIAYKNNITSKMIYFDSKTGIKLKEYIVGDSLNHLSKYDYKKVATLFHKFHDSTTLLEKDYEPFKRLDLYEKEVSSFSKLDERYIKIKSFLMANKHRVDHTKKTICHNDAQKSNIIATDNDYFLVDFEFAANNDPIYDIASFANNSLEDGLNLLNEYFVNPSVNETERFYYWRIFISMQWYLVALIKNHQGQDKKSNFNYLEVAEYFIQYAAEVFAIIEH